MGLEHISADSACQDRRIRVGGGTDGGHGVRAGVDVRQLLAVEVVHGRAASCAWPRSGGPPGRGRDQAEDGVCFVFVARAVEHDPVAGGEPGQGDGMDFGPSCRDRGLGRSSGSRTMCRLPSQGGNGRSPGCRGIRPPGAAAIWSRSQIARSAGWATVPDRSSTSGRANTCCASIACMPAGAFWSCWMCGAHGVCGRSPGRAGRTVLSPVLTVDRSRFGMTWSPLPMTSMQATGSVTARFTRTGAGSPPAAGPA
jgi:hypothetical protein